MNISFEKNNPNNLVKSREKDLRVRILSVKCIWCKIEIGYYYIENDALNRLSHHTWGDGEFFFSIIFLCLLFAMTASTLTATV